jgi:hypothetical protein
VACHWSFALPLVFTTRVGRTEYTAVVRQLSELDESPVRPPMNQTPADHDADAAGCAATAPRERTAASTLRRFALGSLVGAALGILAMLVALRLVNRDPTPPLTPELFHAAHDRWKSAAPASYDIEVRVTGSQPAIYRVEVRDGLARAAWRNDQALTTRRTFDTWSVPGMFGTIGRDIESLERHAAGKADRFTPRLTLRAQFDPVYSFPARYRRLQQRSNVDVAWQVTEFRVIDQ